MMINETWTGNNIGHIGAMIISESLETNTTLTELYLHCEEENQSEMKKKW